MKISAEEGYDVDGTNAGYCGTDEVWNVGRCQRQNKTAGDRKFEAKAIAGRQAEEQIVRRKQEVAKSDGNWAGAKIN